MIEAWRGWVAAFDAACADDDWQRLVPLLTPDARYTVSGVPYACDLVGRDAVIAGWARSVRGFDRHFDERHWYGVGIRIVGPGIVIGRAMGRYVKRGLPELRFSARSVWVFRDDRLAQIVEVYDPSEADLGEALAWLAEHGGHLDPRYA